MRIRKRIGLIGEVGEIDTEAVEFLVSKDSGSKRVKPTVWPVCFYACLIDCMGLSCQQSAHNIFGKQCAYP